MVVSAAASGSSELIDDTANGLVEAAEPDGAEVDVPETVVDLLDADLEFCEQGRCDPSASPAGPALDEAITPQSP